MQVSSWPVHCPFPEHCARGAPEPPVASTGLGHWGSALQLARIW